MTPSKVAGTLFQRLNDTTVERGEALIKSYTERLVAIITALSTFEVGKNRP